MKSKAFFIVLVTALTVQVQANAQTRFQVMAQQVAGLTSYLHSMKSLYSTTQTGLNTAHDLKSGTFSLHQNYFNSLGTVSPAVKNDPKIKGISDLQQQIETTFNNAISWQRDKGILSASEQSEMKDVYNNLLSECAKILDELSLVTTDGKTQMKDAERVHKIDALYSDMQQKYTFSRSYTAGAYDLANNRAADKSDKQVLQKIYGIN